MVVIGASMVTRTQARPSNRRDVSSDAREFDVDLDDHDRAPDEATVVIDGEETVIVEDGSQEWRFDVIDEAAARVDPVGIDESPEWVIGVLQALGIDPGV